MSQGLRHLELDRLLAMAQQLVGAADARTVATEALNALTTLYGFPRAAFLAVDDRQLSVLAAHALSPHRAADGQHSTAVDHALDTSQTRVLRDWSDTDEPWLATLLPADSELLIVPITDDGEDIAALILQLPLLRAESWPGELVEPLERAAALIGRALRAAQRSEQMQLMAATDSLTMIPNRRTFAASLERELNRSLRSGQPVSLVMLDLDEFKQINDQYGHQAGDEALRNVAEVLSVACRDLDVAARYGGEEFVVILPDCPRERSVQVAERLRTAVSAASAPRRLTASAGVATFPEHARDLDSLIRAADEALLVSKQTGRNRTTAASAVSDRYP